MSSENMNFFTKENLNTYLKELGKEYRRLNGKTIPAEIVLIGGAAIIANYAEEKHSKELLVKFEQDYPGIVNTENVNDILRNLKKK